LFLLTTPQLSTGESSEALDDELRDEWKPAAAATRRTACGSTDEELHDCATPNKPGWVNPLECVEKLSRTESRERA
jgi:hypothetical protein